MYPVYCHMSSLSTKCGGGGWTLVMKLDRNKVKPLTYIHLDCLFSFKKLSKITENMSVSS